ncbi:hypothetical protein ES703_103308 [subsurface metagenome]
MSAPEGLNLSGVGGVAKLFVHTEDNKFRSPADIRVSQRLDDNLRPNTGGIAHRYTDDHLLSYRIVAVSSHNRV